MKRILLTMTVWMCLTAVAQTESAYRFVVLETLISNHKSLSNKLKERGLIEASVMAATDITTDHTEDYQDIIKTMQKRIEGSFANVQFAADLASLTSMAVKTAQKSANAVDYALENIVGNPLIIPATVHVVERSGQCINTIYKLVSMVASAGTGIVLATNEDRTQFCFIIRSKLLEIQYLMDSLMQVTMGSNLISTGNSGDHQRIRQILMGIKDVDAMQMASGLINKAAAGL